MGLKSNWNKQLVAIFGAGGHAKVVADLVTLNGGQVLGFIDDVNPIGTNAMLCGKPVVTRLDALPAAQRVIIAFGANTPRLRLFESLSEQGLSLPSIVHPSAVVAADATLGPATVVMAQAVVQAGARVGAACIINTGAIVEHDDAIGDGVHLAPRACLCGSVRVGNRTFVGAGTVVREKIEIGSDVEIGAGSVIVKHLPSGVRAWGVPARVCLTTQS